MDDKKFYLNINKLEAKLGPYYKGASYTKLKVKIINLTKEIITCNYHQKNPVTDLSYENENGFFNLVFPLDKIVLDYNENTEYHFSGTIDFYAHDSKESFKEISYDICLLFLSPSIFLKVNNYSLAIKDGDAQILPFYAIQNSNITFECIPYYNQVKIIELPENTAKRPIRKILPGIFSIDLPKKDIDQDHFATQLDFGLSSNIPAPISVNLDIKRNNIDLLIYCDKRKDFLQKDAYINVGNLWRNVYVLIIYFNPNGYPAKAKFNFNKLITEFYEIQQIETMELKPYHFTAEILSFKIRLIKKPEKRISENNELEINIENLSAKAQFTVNLDFIFIDTKRNTISSNKFLDSCAYWDGNKFVKYHKKDEYSMKEENVVVSPISYDIIINSPKGLPSIIYDDFGEFKKLRNSEGIDFEILVLDPNDNENQIKIETLSYNRIFNNERRPIRLFGRIKNKPNTVFPLFGISSKSEKFELSKYDKLEIIINEFNKWTKTLLMDQDIKNFPEVEKNSELKFFYTSSYNFAYVISSLVQYKEKLNYAKVLIPEIQKFTDLDIIHNKYISNQKINNLSFKFINFIMSLYETMSILFDTIKSRRYTIDFPIPFDKILEEQKKQILDMKLDKSSAESSKEYQKKKNQNTIEEYNNQKIDEFTKNGYKISHYAKWTFENKFQEIKQEEYPKDEKIEFKDFKNEIKPEYSNESGNIVIPDVSFNNMNNILDTYKAFNLILKNAYQYTISIHHYLIKGDQKQLHHSVNILNQLVSFFLWANKIKDYSPYPSFFSKFFSAYQSMMSRLEEAGMPIRKGHLNTNEKNINSGDDFITMPDVIRNLEIFDWKQLGRNKKTEQKGETKKQQQKKEVKNENNKNNQTQDRNKAFTKYSGNALIPANKGSQHAEKEKKINITSEEGEEVPNQEYIDYIVDQMIHPGKERNTIPIFDDDKSHIPANYEIEDPSKFSLEKVDYFFNEAENLTGTILNGLAQKMKIINNCDNCYASILVDCSNTFSKAQKASLILLTIAYGNALTALRIPYSIIVFCDENYQFILKKLEEKHEKIHFLRLIEAMTINRRMASISDAIQIAKAKIVPSKDGPYSQRTNHIIYTFSDGLSTSLNIPKQWCDVVLNDNLVTVSFFFLNIITGNPDLSQEILKIWSSFATKISRSQSKTTVFYSTSDGILKNKDFYRIIKSNNQNNDSLSKLIPLVQCFGQPILQSVAQNSQKSKIKPCIKLESFDFNADSLDLILSNFGFDSKSEKLYEVHSEETKYYRNNSYDIPAYEPHEIEVPSIKIEPFYVNLIMNNADSERKLYNEFTNCLNHISTKMVEQSDVQEMISFVFAPNKPSQYAPSSDGTLFYFPGLIRFLLTQGQDTKIFLEKKAGLTKSYSVFTVIDCTTSCFNIQSSIHAFQSIFVSLQTISKIDLPSFNLIITTNDEPLILCSEKSTFEALAPNSPIWATLFSYLLNPHENSCLDSALLYMLAIRSQEKELSSILFVFTDGNFSENYDKTLNSIFDIIESYNVEAITIGIGSFSSNINMFSTKKIWSINPKNIIKAILAVFGKETSDLVQEIQSLYLVKSTEELNIKEVEAKLSMNLEYNKIDDYELKKLITELNNITRNISVFSYFYNIAPNGSETLTDGPKMIGKKNYYRGFKILICQFWDKSMSYNENENVSKEVLINGTDENHISVINALKEFGIDSKIVQNYKEGIESITSGEFSQVWVICGRYDGRMPDKSKTANLASQFIEVLLTYWENGGGIAFWTDNAPLDAEVNFFLSRAKFDDDHHQQATFRIGGYYPGETMLKRSNRIRESTFTSENVIQCDGYEKPLFNYNMNKIYEGITISSAIIPPENAKSECYDDENINYTFAYQEDIYPFNYFSVSSSGGISSMYYNAPLNSPKGDIVIDCGFSKLFFELTTEGIYNYVCNIAIFLLSAEKKMSKIGGTADPSKTKPKKFDYLIHPYASPEPKFYTYNEERNVDIVFLIDGTGSMRFLIDAVINSCKDIAQYCKEKFSENMFRFGAVIYRDNAVKSIRDKYNHYAKKYYNPDDTEYCPLNKGINSLHRFLTEVETRGGGYDGPEDWLSGYQKLAKMNWNKRGERVVIHIADAPGHGHKFNKGRYTIPQFTDDPDETTKDYENMENEHDEQFPKLIKWAADNRIRIFCLSGGKYPLYSFEKTQKIYQKNHGIQFEITKLNNYGENISEEQKEHILEVVKNVALNSIDKAVAVKKNDDTKSENPTPATYSRRKNKKTKDEKNYKGPKNDKVKFKPVSDYFCDSDD